jgi:hypothetical protein
MEKKNRTWYLAFFGNNTTPFMLGNVPMLYSNKKNACKYGYRAVEVRLVPVKKSVKRKES